MTAKATLRTCVKGHQYYKSSDCPTCPVCEKEKMATEGFLSVISAPAVRALQSLGITTIQQLAGYTEKQLLKAHGFGPASLPPLRKALQEAGLAFREK